ncbi:MAG TPA: peptidoglycan DD-metalloendopeptidase family protein [Candidatus Saccharimonadales bacterium]
MIKSIRWILRIGGYVLLSSVIALASLSPEAFAESVSDRYTETDNQYFDESATVCGSGTGGASAASIANVPEPWRSLIAGQIANFPKVDPRLVAATLWAENRGWPPADKDWQVSGAGAAGPWQFIVPTWQGMMPGYSLDDRNKPEIAVIAAFKHQENSAGLPILQGYADDPQTGYSNLTFYRSMDPSKTSLMYFMAKYNGSGAPDGQTLSNFPRNENSDYVKMGYWLITSNFERGWLPDKNDFVDAKNTSSSAGGAATGSGSSACGSAAGAVNSEGYAFPVGGMPKGDISNGYGWPCKTVCHHDGTPAFDLTHKDAITGTDGAAVGKPTYAIYKGKIENVAIYRGQSGCFIYQLIGENNAQYWYIHVQNMKVKEGDVVQAGQQLSEIGERRCTGNGSYPHLHIDQSPDGSLSTRNIQLVALLNKLYEELK